MGFSLNRPMTLPSAAVSVYRRIPPTIRGIIFMVLSTLCFACMQTLVRWLSARLHPFEIVFFRTLFAFPIFLPMFLRYGIGVLRTTRPGLQVVRGLLSTLAMLTFFMALSMTPLVKAAALDFSGPLFASVGAVIFLGERIRIRRVTALVVGAIGVMVIVQPGIVDLDLGSMLVLISAIAWGGAILTIKVMSRTDSSVTITLYLNIIALPFALVAAIPEWQTPTGAQLLVLLVIGTLGGIGHFMFAQSCREADVSAVMPLDFLRLIWVAISGYLVFNEVPDAWTWFGAVMIFSAVVYITYRESRVAKAPPVPAAPISP